MKLTKDHIGKMIKHRLWHLPEKLLAINEFNAWFGTASVYSIDGDWVIVEPRKKPSERIKEMVRARGIIDISDIWVIAEFLDEMAQDIELIRKDPQIER